jgi:MFS family permease
MKINFTKQNYKLILLSGLGGLLEFYDFVIYAVFASYIASNFFPTGNYVTSLLATFATFSIGYLVRPFGGIVFGHFGDKIGRKASFTVTIFLMAISTFLIGLVPSYQAIGIVAPIIILLLRILQGFSVGGAIPGALTYTSESLAPHYGFACGLVSFLVTNGVVLGLLVYAILSYLLTTQQIASWGWRIPFFVGGFLGAFSYYLRREVFESPLFIKVSAKVAKFPLVEVLKNNFRAFICGTFLVALSASLNTLLFIFTPAYFGSVLKYPVKEFIWINTSSLFVSTLIILLFGFVSDYINKKWWLLILAILSLILAGPIFYLFVHPIYSLWIPMLFGALAFGSIMGLVPAILVELFPTHIRYSGVAFAYNLGFAIFGGLTPVIAMTLIRYTTVLSSPSYYMMLTSLLGVICALMLPKRRFL